jgi:hypothetical protein
MAATGTFATSQDRKLMAAQGPKRKLTFALVVGSECLPDARDGNWPVTDGKELARIDHEHMSRV